MTKTFYADPSKVAIYDGARNEAVETSPLSHLDKIYFHSDLPYLGIKSVVEGSADINNSGYSGAPGQKTVTLFSHGLGYRPLVFGQVWDNKPYIGDTGPVPFSGTVPWWGDRDHPTSGGSSTDIVHLHLLVDETAVKVNLRRSRATNAAGYTISPPAVAFNYRILLTDVELPV